MSHTAPQRFEFGQSWEISELAGSWNASRRTEDGEQLIRLDMEV